MSKARMRGRYAKLLGLLTAGMTFQVLTETNGCAELYTSFALGAFDFCSLLNCQGTGFFNFCTPVAVLLDCPNLAAA
ncbi:MAG: hypothetical protein SF069_03730 [Phycisphaerae bacterium]|nr:hypothetical protein [Phycisphaerae bacterium]